MRLRDLDGLPRLLVDACDVLARVLELGQGRRHRAACLGEALGARRGVASHLGELVLLAGELGGGGVCRALGRLQLRVTACRGLVCLGLGVLEGTPSLGLCALGLGERVLCLLHELAGGGHLLAVCLLEALELVVLALELGLKVCPAHARTLERASRVLDLCRLHLDDALVVALHVAAVLELLGEPFRVPLERLELPERRGVGAPGGGELTDGRDALGHGRRPRLGGPLRRIDDSLLR